MNELEYDINLVKSISEIPSDVSAYVLSLPSNQVCRRVVGEINDRNENEKVILDCSTISPKLVKELNALMSESSNLYLDSPMSGGVPGSKNKTLTFMLGMDSES